MYLGLANHNPSTIGGLDHRKRRDAHLDSRYRSWLARGRWHALRSNRLSAEPLLSSIRARKLASHAASQHVAGLGDERISEGESTRPKLVTKRIVGALHLFPIT